MRYYKLKYKPEYLFFICVAMIAVIIVFGVIQTNEITSYTSPLRQLLIVLLIILIIAFIIGIKKNMYNKKLKKNTEPKELYYIDTWLMCYGSKSVETRYDYLLVFKDKNNKKYIARSETLNGKYNCKINKNGFKLFYQKKGEIFYDQKFKVYIDEDYGYTIYDEESEKLVLRSTAFIKEEKNLNKDLTKYNYIMMNQEANLSDFDDAIYFKGIIEL